MCCRSGLCRCSSSMCRPRPDLLQGRCSYLLQASSCSNLLQGCSSRSDLLCEGCSLLR